MNFHDYFPFVYDVYIIGYMMYTSLATWLHGYRQTPDQMKKNSRFSMECIKIL